MTWDPVCCVAGYHIYKNGVVVATITVNENLIYYGCSSCWSNSANQGYAISSFNSAGAESAQVPLTIRG